jgi:hypothetical protein
MAQSLGCFHAQSAWTGGAGTHDKQMDYYQSSPEYWQSFKEANVTLLSTCPFHDPGSTT